MRIIPTALLIPALLAAATPVSASGDGGETPPYPLSRDTWPSGTGRRSGPVGGYPPLSPDNPAVVAEAWSAIGPTGTGRRRRRGTRRWNRS